MIARLLSDATSRVQQWHKHRPQTKNVLRHQDTKHDGSTRTARRPRSKQSCSMLPSLLTRTTRHLVRKRRSTLHVGSHHTPTHQHRARQLHGMHNTRKRSMSRARHRSRPNHRHRDTSFYSQTTQNSCWQKGTSTMERRPAPHQTHTNGHSQHIDSREPHATNGAASHASDPTTKTQRCTDGLTRLQPRRTKSRRGRLTCLQFRRPHAQHLTTCCTGRLTCLQLHRATLRIITTTDD